MNKLWRLRIKQNRFEEGKRQSNLKLLKVFCAFAVVFVFCYPQYIKRLVYPYIIGEKAQQKQQISAYDFFKDVDMPDIEITRNGRSYVLSPKTAYKVTGRVGIVDNYDGLLNKIYRWHQQSSYINLVPRDVFLVIGKMAEPEIFEMFDFKHEERLGGVLCKGVKYRTSFMSYFQSEKEYMKSKENYDKCDPYIKEEEKNNYHPIPATENINRALSMLVKGDVVSLEGLLVDVPEMGLSTGTRKNQVHDNMVISGANPGKCFVLYTTKVTINGTDYK